MPPGEPKIDGFWYRMESDISTMKSVNPPALPPHIRIEMDFIFGDNPDRLRRPTEIEVDVKIAGNTDNDLSGTYANPWLHPHQHGL